MTSCDVIQCSAVSATVVWIPTHVYVHISSTCSPSLSNSVFPDAWGTYSPGCSKKTCYQPCEEWISWPPLQIKHLFSISRVVPIAFKPRKSLAFNIHTALEHSSSWRKLRWATGGPRASESPSMWHTFPSALTDITNLSHWAHTLPRSPSQHHPPGSPCQLVRIDDDYLTSLKNHLHFQQQYRAA